ncbi:MAG TPA: hypothetical protein DCZ92_01505 [Elusimicrobia bacterium]|nr:MAG: hypothetical protein A2016_12410 [Elusimicrobia bacterium GWF2_62_30]HBA59502.1 hypothetical protein [Elusimicrobiota bacterium]
MKIFLALACILAAGLYPANAQEPDNIGAGIMLGKPAGVTAKLLYGSRAVATGIGFGTELTLYGDYLWDLRGAQPRSSGGKLPLYLGLGFQVSPEEFGLRVVAGIAYWLPHRPVELFCDVIPVLRLSPGDSGGLGVSAGLRYYFKGT